LGNTVPTNLLKDEEQKKTAIAHTSNEHNSEDEEFTNPKEHPSEKEKKWHEKKKDIKLRAANKSQPNDNEEKFEVAPDPHIKNENLP
jgi:hypothetical protein